MPRGEFAGIEDLLQRERFRICLLFVQTQQPHTAVIAKLQELHLRPNAREHERVGDEASLEDVQRHLTFVDGRRHPNAGGVS